VVDSLCYQKRKAIVITDYILAFQMINNLARYSHLSAANDVEVDVSMVA
jgi:hypothetical protein